MSEMDEVLLRSLTPNVLGILVRRGADFAAAEDAVQESLVEALRAWRESAPDDPKAWLITVASRRLTDLLLMFSYVTLALPFIYRAVDTGLRSIDVRTLTEAAESLGAGWPTILFRVIFPNIRVAVLSGAFLNQPTCQLSRGSLHFGEPRAERRRRVYW